MMANILGSLFGGLVDKEKAVKEIIQSALENALEEVNETRKQDAEYTHENIFFMIMPSDKEMNFKVYLYLNDNGKRTPIRELSLKEILGED